MPSNRKELFRASTTNDKLVFLQSLFNAKALTEDLTLALLKVVHRELGVRQGRAPSVYKRYAKIIASLRYYQFDEFQRVVDAWNNQLGSAL